MTARASLDDLLRYDFGTFLHKVFRTLAPNQPFIGGWYINALAHALQRVQRGECRRLIINMPPRMGKSISASVAFPAYLLGRDPTRRIICVSYGVELARKMANDFRAVLATDWYRELFPDTRISDTKDSEGEVAFTRHGFRLATSVGGTLTGRGGDIIIVDDPIKPLDALSEPKRQSVNQWFSNTLLSRLDSKVTGAIVIVMQRVHAEDLTGFVLEQGDDWEVLRLPAFAEVDETIPLAFEKNHHRKAGDVLSPAREPSEALEHLKALLGPDHFSAQYQQCPIPPGGATFKRDWIERFDELPPDNSDMMVVQSWDTASKEGPDNDYSVCTTWHRRWTTFHLVDVFRARLGYPALKRKVMDLASAHRAHLVLVEETGVATGLIAELKDEIAGLTAVRPNRDKRARASIASARFSARQVFLPRSAPWLVDYETELLAFPGSRHDDQVDSTSQALNYDYDSGFNPLMYVMLAQR